MRSEGVALPAPAISQGLGHGHGDPGSMYAVVVPLALLQRLRTWAMNSSPLSLRMNVGAG
jgi:hypothetical protein